MVSGNKYIGNFVWRLLENWGSQIVALIVTMILARLLDPSANGIIAIITVFTSICALLIDGGFATALVQKKDADELDFSSVFYFSIVSCVILYGVLYFVAPVIACFYEIEELTQLVRVQSLILIVSGVRSVQSAYVSKKMLFRKSFFSTFSGTILSAVAGIWMAYKGFGVWALVTQSLVNNVVGTVILWTTVRWRPRKMFSVKRLKSLFSYGSKLLLSNLLYRGYADLRQLIIGKVYTSADLAYYNRASNLPTLVNSSISNSITSIMLPALSDKQNDLGRIKAMLKRTIELHSYILVPMFIGMLACAKPLIVVMFSEKWLPSVPYLRIFCLTYIFEGLGMANLTAFKAKGYSGLTLKIECIKTPIYIIILLATIPFGMMAVAYGVVIGVFIAEMICVIPSKKLFGYSLFQQLKDIGPHLLLSAFMGVCVWSVSLLEWNALLMLLVQIPLGIVIYVLGSIVLKLETFYYILNLVKGLLKKRSRSKTAS